MRYLKTLFEAIIYIGVFDLRRFPTAMSMENPNVHPIIGSQWLPQIAESAKQTWAVRLRDLAGPDQKPP